MTPEDKVRRLLGRAGDAGAPAEEEWQAFLSQAHRSLAVRRGAAAAGLVVLIALGVAAGAVLTRNPVGAPEPHSPGGSPEGSVTPTEPEPSASAEPRGQQDGNVVQVWFLQRSDTAEAKLVAGYRDIGDTTAVGRAAMEALLAGPNETEGAWTPIPRETRLLDLTIEDGIATVDLSTEFDETGLGSSSEHLPIAQVVFTLTQFDTVKAVVFEIEGERVEFYGGHGLVIDKPQKRKHYEADAPPIIVDRPFPGHQVGTTFELEGSANVFEATVSYRVVAGDGQMLAEGFTTATCGTGCRGDYSETITVDVQKETRAVIRVFESSAEDGSPLHVVRVPVTFVPNS